MGKGMESQREDSKESSKEDIGPRVVEPVFENKNGIDEQIKAKIVLSLATFTDKTPPTKICESLKAMLDSKFGSGWCVFAGGHLAGSCVFEEGYFAQVSFGAYTIILFRTFIPQK